MFKRISIANFRGIKQGQLDDLAHVNILVGQNNSGKSTVLEAFILARAPITPIDRLGRHGIRDLLERRVGDRPELDFRELWYKLEKTTDIEIELELTTRNIINMKISAENPIASVIRYEIRQVFNGGKEASRVIEAKTSRIRTQVNPILQQYRIALSEIMLIDSDYIHRMESVERNLWQDIKATRKDIEIRRTLNKVYDLDVENLSFIPYAEGRFKLYAEMPNRSVPIDDLGEGLRYALAILSTMVMLEHTALLIEELEVHQHPEALNCLLTALFKVAKINDIQLFISTQSLELINYALETSEKEGLEIKLYHLILNKEGILTARVLSAPDAKLLAEVGPDIRLLHKYVSV